MTWVVAAGLALLGAQAGGWLVRVAWSNRALDAPDHRSSHQVPTTRLGGTAVAIGLAAGLVAADLTGAVTAGMALAATVAGVAGLLEDLRGVSIAARLLAQVAAAALAVPLLVSGQGGWLVVAAFWIVAFTNMYNFMDGVDGLAGAQLAIAGLAWLVAGTIEEMGSVQMIGAVSAGCAAGFLPHNFPRPRVFMGDFGAYAAGAWLAAGVVVAIDAGISPVVATAPLAVFVFDTSWTLLARLRRGENIFLAHQSHLYQRLVRSGWSHAKTTAVVSSVAMLVAAAGLVALVDTQAADVAAVTIGVLGLGGYAVLAARVCRPARMVSKQATLADG